MRENRTHGSEGGEGERPFLPLSVGGCFPTPDAGDLQPSWCRLWLWVQKHRQSLANLIGQTRSKDKNIAEKLVQAEASLEPMLVASHHELNR